MWVAENFPVCALQLIKCGAKDLTVVIDTISEGSPPPLPESPPPKLNASDRVSCEWHAGLCVCESRQTDGRDYGILKSVLDLLTLPNTPCDGDSLAPTWSMMRFGLMRPLLTTSVSSPWRLPAFRPPSLILFLRDPRSEGALSGGEWNTLMEMLFHECVAKVVRPS